MLENYSMLVNKCFNSFEWVGFGIASSVAKLYAENRRLRLIFCSWGGGGGGGGGKRCLKSIELC